MRGLRGRLTLGVMGVLAVVMAVAGVLVARDSARTDRQLLDDRLRRTADLTQATAVAALDSSAPVDDRPLAAQLIATDSSLTLTVGGSLPIIDAGRKPSRRPPSRFGFQTVTIRGKQYRVYTVEVKDSGLGGAARIQTTSGLSALERRQSRLRLRLTIGGLILLAIAGAGVWFTAELVLSPLRRLGAATGGIATDDDLDRRVPDDDGPREVRELAARFNGMLARLGRSADDRTRALLATRRFAADVGHELRTPLTSVQATLDALSRHPDIDADRRAGLLEGALEEQRRLVDLLDGLQALARGDAMPGEREEVDLAEVVADVVARARTEHPDVALTVVLPDEPVVVDGWGPGLRLLAGNLVSNAIRHGREEDAHVDVVLTATGPTLVVDDDGPGIPEAERGRVFEAFVRVPGRERPGSGLGLALVAQQARLHDATVAITDAPAGGARFTVRFGA